MTTALTKLAVRLGVLAAVVGVNLVIHKVYPWPIEAAVYTAEVLILAMVASTPEKVTASRHIARTAGELTLKVFVASLARAGGWVIGLVVLAGAWTLYAPSHPDQAKIVTSVGSGAKTGAQQVTTVGKVKTAGSKLFDDLSGAWDRTREHRRQLDQDEASQGASGGRSR